MRRLAWLAPSVALLAASCSAPQNREFYVNAVNTEEQQIAAVIYVDDEVILNQKNEPIRTPANVKLTFEPSDGGMRRVKVSTRAVVVDADGKVTYGLREGEASPYIEEPRMLDPRDAKDQLFILRRNKDFVE
jgi:hypothetical protein